MSFTTESLSPSFEWRSWFGIVRGLCFLALGLSGYLLWKSLKGEQIPGCGVESGCGAVLNSKWAYVFGVPVSLPAVLLYCAVLGVTFAGPLWRQRVRGFMVAAAAALIGAAIWFICLQLFVIGAICPFCMTAHSCGLVIGAVVLLNTRRQKEETGANKTDALLRGPNVQWILTGSMAVALLAAGQIVSRPRTAVVISAPDLAARKTSRILQLHGDAFQLDLGKIPVLGSPAAPCVIVHLFDYSCPHCRALHPMLVEAVRTLSNQVAVASLPMPMATNCNPIVQRVMPLHTNACAYAYSGLAVWRANPAKLATFDDWIFAPNRPPSPEAVQAEAMSLVGTNQFKAALADPWIKEQLALSIRLYVTNHVLYHRDNLPELMIGTNLVWGNFAKIDELYKLVAPQFNDLPKKEDP
jgi:uncharacterized membrane protein/protein-disulfide isomerase